MNSILLISYILFSTPNTNVLDAIIEFESHGNSYAYNSSENAAGCLQIRPVMVRDINRILKLNNSSLVYTIQDRWKCSKSKEMFWIYQLHYKFTENETMARAWNGGPSGPRKNNTQLYWKRVKDIIDAQSN